MKTINEFLLDEGKFTDFMQKAQSRIRNPIDFSMDSTNPIVQVSNGSRASRLIPLSKAKGTMQLKKALKSLVQFGSLTVHGSTMTIYTGALDIQRDVYRKFGV